MTKKSLKLIVSMLDEEKCERKYYAASDCPITATIGVIGGKWKPILIWILMRGPQRFGVLHRTIPGIALKVLSRHLKELEEDGIITRTAFAEVPPRVEYALSEKGRSLAPVMESLARWSRTNIMALAEQ